MIENEHEDHILKTSRVPANVTPAVATEARRIAEKIAAKSGFFQGLSVGKLLVAALGLSGPLGVAVIMAGGLAGRRVKKRLGVDREIGRLGDGGHALADASERAGGGQLGAPGCEAVARTATPPSWHVGSRGSGGDPSMPSLDPGRWGRVPSANMAR